MEKRRLIKSLITLVLTTIFIIAQATIGTSKILTEQYDSQVVYYVDQSKVGSKTADGSMASPWSTLPAPDMVRIKAQDTGKDIVVIVEDGVYEGLEISKTANKSSAGIKEPLVIYRAAFGAKPRFKKIDIEFDTLTDSNLRFEGIEVGPIPGEGTLGDGEGSVTLKNASNVVFQDMVIGGTHQFDSGDCAYVSNCSNIGFIHCEIRYGGTGVKVIGTNGITIKDCHIHSIYKSGISYNQNCSNALIEGNHIHNQDTYEGSHASGISLRSGDVVIRNNIIHDGFTSSGIMTYDDDMGNVYNFHNVTLENNLLYDIRNQYCLRFYKIGENVVVRNNTFVGKYTGKKDGRYYLTTAMMVHSYAEGSNGSGVSLHNNIFAGMVSIPGTITNAHNNIFWSLRVDGEFTSTAPGTGSIVKTSTYANNPESWFAEGFWAEPAPNFEDRHGEMLDYKLADTSPAINFGNAYYQPPDSLGTVGEDGFIIKNGPSRNSSCHSAGALEYGTSTPTPTPTPTPTMQTVTVDSEEPLINYVSGSGWALRTNSNCYGGSERYIKQNNAYAEFTFTGTSVSLIASKRSDSGIARIYIDGVEAGTVDFYAPSTMYQQVVFTRSGLSYGQHTIKIEVALAKNPNSSNYYIIVDALKYETYL